MAGNDQDRASFRLFGAMLQSAVSFSLSQTGVPQFTYCNTPIDIVLVQGTVVYLKRHYQFLHFVSDRQALDDMTGIVECVYFFSEAQDGLLQIGDKIRIRGKLRLYNDTIQVTARSGICTLHLDRVESSDEELHWLQSGVRLLRQRLEQTAPVACRRTYRSVRPLHYPDYLLTLEVIKCLSSFQKREIDMKEVEEKSEGFITREKLKTKLCALASAGLVDIRETQGGAAVCLGEESIHPRDQVLKIIKNGAKDEGVQAFQISEELSRCSVDMHHLLPLFLSELVKSGAIYEVENRRFKLSR